MSANPAGSRVLRSGWLLGRDLPARLRESLDATLHLLGFAEPRTDRAPAALTIRLGAPGESDLAVSLPGEQGPRTYRFPAGSDDLSDRLRAVAGGGRAGAGILRAKILVDPGACFARSLTLPAAALPRMRAVLAQELEAATPFRAEAVYSDWFVEGEDAGARTLRVRHVVLKRTRLDPLLHALSGAGLAAGPVTVGRAEDLTMPVDLLSGGHRALPSLFSGTRGIDLALVLGALLLALVAFWGLRQHQERTLAALDEAFATARRAAGPPVPLPVRAGGAAILSERAPPLVPVWDAVAAALPDTASATGLRLDADGLTLTLAALDEAAALSGLGRVPGFGAPTVRNTAAGPDGARLLVVVLPRADRGRRP